MITLDAVRAALLATDPYDRMDALVRAELAAGRSVQSIIDELNPLIDATLDTSGLTADGEEAFLGTLDRLTGDCDPSQHYQDPPALPTEEEIAKLPRWARVAFAARCARRVLPLFTHNWPTAPSEYRSRLGWMVAASEQAAELGDTGETLLSPVVFTAYACDAVINSNRDHNRVAEVLSASRNRVVKLPEANADVVAYVVRVCANNAAIAAAHAVADNAETYPAALAAMEGVIRSDFSVLQRLAVSLNWTDNTPVSPNMFGPLWPDGLPSRWPVTESEATADTAGLGASELVS